MKPYQLILIILISGFLQASLFYGEVGMVMVNLILCISWVLYLSGERDYSAFYVLFAGIFVDILKLSGIGTTSFLIFLPIVIFVIAEALFSLKRDVVKYIFILALIAFGALVGILVNRVFGNITLVNWQIVGSSLISAMLNWGVIVILMTVRTITQVNEGTVSFIRSRKK